MTNCVSLSNYQSAKVNDDGISEIGLTFGWNSYARLDSSGKADEDSVLAIPVILPEISFGTALNKRIEIGGRAMPQTAGIEGTFKWGFYQGKSIYLAIAPSLGLRAFPYGQGFSRFPLLFTWDINKKFSIHSSLFFGHSQAGESSNEEYNEWIQKTFGASNSGGMSLGFQFSGETFTISPILEVSGISPADPDEVEWEPYGRTGVAIYLGWKLGKENQQLDRIEKKLDETSP